MSTTPFLWHLPVSPIPVCLQISTSTLSCTKEWGCSPLCPRFGSSLSPYLLAVLHTYWIPEVCPSPSHSSSMISGGTEGLTLHSWSAILGRAWLVCILFDYWTIACLPFVDDCWNWNYRMFYRLYTASSCCTWVPEYEPLHNRNNLLCFKYW